VDVVAGFSRVRYVLEILEVYDREEGKSRTGYKAWLILVKPREEAEELIHVLDKGGDFSALAKEKSADTSASEGGGDIGWFSTVHMAQPPADVFTRLNNGSYTEERVQTQFGWQVILLDDMRESTPPAFDDVKDRFKVLVANQ
jgi:peptidyl-prolyl cis-trans isomerase C